MNMMNRARNGWLSLLTACLPLIAFAAEPPASPDAARVSLQWGVKIPMRDGVRLNATVYTPKGQQAPAPCIFTLTPYIAQSYHDRGVYFAAHGLPFLTVDVRGRGNSEGVFRPLIQEARDGYDVVEWLARQPYCNGKVSMWGGSYAGYDQWATAKEFPPHLATIVPAAAPYIGVDFPSRGNIFDPYLVQWLTFTSGHTSQINIFGDQAFWNTRNLQWLESGAPFKDLDERVGNPLPVFQEWISHPAIDAYWDAYNPTAEQYAKLGIPILTITGSYDDDQPGALAHYREYMKHASAEGAARHYLIIGPWDHAGTRTPQAQVGGLTFGAASLLDLPRLHLDWYAWTMQGGAKPEFLKKRVAYYVMQADEWRYADSLEAVTAQHKPLYLDSATGASDVLASGSLQPVLAKGKPDQYRYDPRDLGTARLEMGLDPGSLTDQTLVFARSGKQLVYHSAAFDKDTELSGFFKLSAWIGIDQPDTDLVVSVSEIRTDGSAIRLSEDRLRARYRQGLRQAQLIQSSSPLQYDFSHFNFTSRLIGKGSRLRLVISPVDSIYGQRNYQSGKDVSAETAQDARTVTVTLYHDRTHPSALYIPIAQPE